jgi:hypothetical protein
MKVGDKVRLKVRDLPSAQLFTITYVGHRSVKVMDELGREHLINPQEARRQIAGRPKKKLTKKQRQARQRWFEERVIYSPMGGEPGYGSGRNRSNY